MLGDEAPGSDLFLCGKPSKGNKERDGKERIAANNDPFLQYTIRETCQLKHIQWRVIEMGWKVMAMSCKNG